MNSRPTVIVLAAGLGSRFGGDRPKLLQPWFGSTVLEATLENAVASHLPVVVVTTDSLAPVAKRHVAARDVVVLPRADGTATLPLGMGFSIAAGVAASPNASGWLVVPADMPLIQPSTMQGVAQQLKKHPVVFAQHGGRRGHPVAFAAELYSELVTLTGDDGAKRLVARYPAHGMVVDDEGALLDVDTPDSLRHAQRVHDAAQQRRGAAPSTAPAGL